MQLERRRRLTCERRQITRTMPTVPQDDLPIIPFESSAAWDDWLDEHHATSRGLWLKIAKKASGITTITYQEAIETALCFGWIDGQRQSFDEAWFLQRFTPRRTRSRWSPMMSGPFWLTLPARFVPLTTSISSGMTK